MANMIYCRFENTFHDLVDCYNNFNDDLDGSEFTFRAKMIELAKKIAKYDVDDFVELGGDDDDV